MGIQEVAYLSRFSVGGLFLNRCSGQCLGRLFLAPKFSVPTGLFLNFGCPHSPRRTATEKSVFLPPRRERLKRVSASHPAASD